MTWRSLFLSSLGCLALSACGADSPSNPLTPFPGDTPGDGMTNTNGPGAGGTNGTATPGGGGDGGEATGSASGGANGVDCETAVVNAEPSIPDMLIVLDRSGSMGNEGRWQPSVDAVKSVTQALQASISFGLWMFPSEAPNPLECASRPNPIECISEINAASCGGGELDVDLALNNASAIASALDAANPVGGTPISTALDGARMHFEAEQAIPDAIVPPQYVLLVADGQPTCPAGGGSNSTPEDINAANAAVEALAGRGIKTYVIGYDTQNDADLAAVLDGLAQRGDTGDSAHRPVADEASLISELESITGEIVSCSYTLDTEPSDPTYVLVELDGVQLNLNDPNGWTLTGATVELQGEACELLQDGDGHQLNVRVLCDPVVPI